MRVLPALLATVLAIPAKSKYIVPGGRWHDTNGSEINAHGAGITFDQKSGKFWWFGEYKTEDYPEGGGVSVYSSEDLSVWTPGGLALGKFTLLSFQVLLYFTQKESQIFNNMHSSD
jgi:hypothetical protein